MDLYNVSPTLRFIERSILVHGDRYDYSKVYYEHSHKKVKIICKIHGEFQQDPCHHLNGRGCKKCAFEKLPQNNPKSTDEFIKKSKIIHRSEYDYSLVNYKKSNEKVKIICKIHGEFNQTPNSHLKGAGCKKCAIIKYLNKKNKISKPEKRLGLILHKLGISFISSFLIKNKVFDFYIPSKNLLIEVDGVYWHSKNKQKLNDIQKKNVENDNIKNKLAKDMGYNLIRIWEDEIEENYVSKYIL